MAVSLTVVGSINLDLVARVEHLPRPGETLSATAFDRIPGGKGANQAVAAARLGAEVTLVGAVGDDAAADEALANLREAGVELDLETVGSTGIALILVAADGENQIVVVPGANALVTPRAVSGAVPLPARRFHDAVVRLPPRSRPRSSRALNASPAHPIDVAALDLLIVNRLEHEVVSRQDGSSPSPRDAEGARCLRGRAAKCARATPPKVDVVDGTAAGVAFAAALVLAVLEERPYDEALTRACAAGALAATRLGAQPSLPTESELTAILAR